MTTQLDQLARYSFEVTDALYQMFKDAKEELQVEEVYYSPQRLIPKFPAIVLEPRPKERRFNGTHRWDLTFRVAIILYHGKVRSSEENHRENEQQAILIEQFLHDDVSRLSLNGRVVLGFVTRVEPGLVERGDVMYTATRLTWEGTSREEF